MSANPFGMPWLTALARAFADAGEPLYAVGGLVRNALMGLPTSDVDVCGPARPERVLAFCQNTPVRAVLRAAHFGTVELHVTDADGRHMAEYTTFREDSYRTGHQPSAVRFADTPEADALRRDFSVNALYRPLLPDPAAPTRLIDPTGGLRHLEQGILHTVTADPDRVFKDDGLRILRAARFQAELGLVPTEALLCSAKKYAPLLRDIAYERLRDELARLLLSDEKYPILIRHEPPVAAGLLTVRTVGAWPMLFGPLRPDDPAIAAMGFYRAPQGVPALSGKMALLFWREEPEALAERMRALRFSARDTAAAQAALTALRNELCGRKSLMDAVRLGIPSTAHAAVALRALVAAGKPCEAEAAEADARLTALLDERVPKSLRDLAVHGGDLLPLADALHVAPSEIGRVLDSLWEGVVEGRLPNDRQALLTQAGILFH